MNIVVMDLLTSPAWDAKSDKYFRDTQWLSHCNALKSCKLIHILFNQIGEFVHTSCALCAGELLPWSLEGCFGSSNCGINVFGASYLYILGNGLLCGWICNGEGLARLGFHKLEMVSRVGRSIDSFTSLLMKRRVSMDFVPLVAISLQSMIRVLAE